jgi:hypothetical protein
MMHTEKFPVAFKAGVVFCETQEEAHMLKEAQYIRRSQKSADGFSKPRLAEIRHLCAKHALEAHVRILDRLISCKTPPLSARWKPNSVAGGRNGLNLHSLRPKPWSDSAGALSE